MSQQKYTREALLELALTLGQSNDFDEVLRLISERTTSLMQADATLLSMINPNTRQTIKTIYAEDKRAARKNSHLLNKTISGWVIKNSCSFLSSNLKNDKRVGRDINRLKEVISVLAVPIRVEGVIIGIILVLSNSGKKAFNEENKIFLEQLATLAAPYLKNLQKIQQYFLAPLPQQVLLDKYQKMGLIGKSPAFIELLKSIEAASRCEVRVLLEGNSGTGKELIARAIHQLSPRNSRPFVAVDCAAIPVNLIESELFGHLKGAFTGAASDRKGLMEEADDSTLFMDEISNLPLDLQAKLLRVLQEGEIRPLGSNATRKVDVRIIAASSSSLKEKMDKKDFRDDLYYRLNVYPIKIPDLTQRIEDIPILARHFLKAFNEQQHKKLEIFHEDILDYMLNRAWPGNIRELENFIERLVTLALDQIKILEPEILPSEFRKEWEKLKRHTDLTGAKKSLTEQVTAFEEQMIRQALQVNDWNQSKAARDLNISEQTIRYKMNKLGIVNLK